MRLPPPPVHFSCASIGKLKIFSLWLQLDLLYDIVRIQRDNQMAILTDVQALCVRTVLGLRYAVVAAYHLLRL